jgi:hypothetical protein
MIRLRSAKKSPQRKWDFANPVPVCKPQIRSRAQFDFVFPSLSNSEFIVLRRSVLKKAGDSKIPERRLQYLR